MGAGMRTVDVGDLFFPHGNILSIEVSSGLRANARLRFSLRSGETLPERKNYEVKITGLKYCSMLADANELNTLLELGQIIDGKFTKNSGHVDLSIFLGAGCFIFRGTDIQSQAEEGVQ